jgi:hypothetical protein
VCGCIRGHIKEFSIGGQLAMKLLAVPGGDATILDAKIERKCSLRQGGTAADQQTGDQGNCRISRRAGEENISRMVIHKSPHMQSEEKGDLSATDSRLPGVLALIHTITVGAAPLRMFDGPKGSRKGLIEERMSTYMQLEEGSAEPPVYQPWSRRQLDLLIPMREKSRPTEEI